MRGTADLPGSIVREPRDERDQRRGPARGAREEARRREPQAGRGLPRGQGQPARLLRRADDEADGRQRRSRGREPRAQARARRRGEERAAAPAVDRAAETVHGGAANHPTPEAPKEATPERAEGAPEPRVRPAPAARPGPASARSPLAQSVVPVASAARPDDAHQRLGRARGRGAARAPGPIPAEALARVDLRVGAIVSAARVPRKDKLLDLCVDVGDEAGPRRIVAGLALIVPARGPRGQARASSSCNLEPRDFGKGLVSHGMILAAGPSDGLALGHRRRRRPPGTRVK